MSRRPCVVIVVEEVPMTDFVPGTGKWIRRPMPTPAEAARLERRRDAAEAARLAGQLEALELDIHAARRTARHAASAHLELSTPSPHASPAAHGERVRLPDGHEILIRP